jgi:hypothetical protein
MDCEHTKKQKETDLSPHTIFGKLEKGASQDGQDHNSWARF